MKDETLKKAGADNSTASMQKAQDLAKNILNLSQSDLDEIMSADGESTKMVCIVYLLKIWSSIKFAVFTISLIKLGIWE